MAINDYILCDECGVKLIYDGKAHTNDYYTNRQWWKDRFGEELKMVCPNCREKNK